MGRVTGKVAIVTGAASGIGAATADVLAREGARVVVADLDADRAREQAQRIVEAGGEAVAVPFDLGDEASIELLVRQAIDAYGRIDVLHNNAAATHLAATADAPLAELASSVWDDTFRINVRGTALMIKAVVPHMIEQRTGSIINTSSMAGMSGDLGHPAYGASKAAINVLTQYAATEFGKHGIRVNAVAPGLIVTGAAGESGHSGPMADIMLANHLTPRLGTPTDIAEAVLFLASEESGFVTGHILRVDGGLSAHAPYVSELRDFLGR
jgi:NAD(P)-dependent dehydrogenase (short-subunit alcohol dehydrogenase family)